jgi:phosphate transport system substrate-binding protein
MAPKRVECIKFFSAGLFFLLILSGCGHTIQKGDVDTPTAGQIKVGIDESYRQLMDAEIYTFQSIYKNAKFDTVYSDEAVIIDLFMKDSIPTMVVNRKLTKEEEDYLNARQIIPRSTLIAYDAVAFIVNNDNPDSNIYYDRIRDIFTGKITQWNQVNPASKLGDIKVIFDNYKSSNPRYLKERFKLDKLPSLCFAVNNNREVISYVEKNKNAIGVISVNWISDPQDTVTVNFLKRIRVMGISPEGNDTPDASFYQPYQAYIVQGNYPFTREVYITNRQTYSGLGYGLASFVAGEKGQLIILRSGMVPATQPIRIVEIKK